MSPREPALSCRASGQWQVPDAVEQCPPSWRTLPSCLRVPNPFCHSLPVQPASGFRELGDGPLGVSGAVSNRCRGVGISRAASFNSMACQAASSLLEMGVMDLLSLDSFAPFHLLFITLAAPCQILFVVLAGPSPTWYRATDPGACNSCKGATCIYATPILEGSVGLLYYVRRTRAKTVATCTSDFQRVESSDGHWSIGPRRSYSDAYAQSLSSWKRLHPCTNHRLPTAWLSSQPPVLFPQTGGVRVTHMHARTLMGTARSSQFTAWHRYSLNATVMTRKYLFACDGARAAWRWSRLHCSPCPGRCNLPRSGPLSVDVMSLNSSGKRNKLV